MVTRASGLPQTGSSLVTGIAAAAWEAIAPPSACASSLAIDTPLLRSTEYISPIPAKKQRKKPTMAVPLFMISPDGCLSRSCIDEPEPRIVAPERRDCDKSGARMTCSKSTPTQTHQILTESACTIHDWVLGRRRHAAAARLSSARPRESGALPRWSEVHGSARMDALPAAPLRLAGGDRCPAWAALGRAPARE